MTLERAQLSAQFYLDRVILQVADLLNRQYPGDHEGPILWLKLVRGLLDTATEYLETSRQQATPISTTENLVKDAGSLAHTGFECLRFMAGADLDDLPYPIVQPMQRWFKDLGLLNTTLFRAEHAAIYELRPVTKSFFQRIRNKSKSLTDAIDAIEWPLIRVTVPGKALGIIPHFSIVAHEVGHAMFNKIGLDLSSEKKKEGKLIKRIETRLSQSPLTHDSRDKLRKVHISWLKELSADAFAFFIMGPALFFASSEFFQLLSPDYGVSETHPPDDLRREVVHNKLLQGQKSFAVVFKDITGETLTKDFNSHLMKNLPNMTDFYDDLINQFSDPLAAAIMTELVPYFRDVSYLIFDQTQHYLEQNCPEIIYTPEEFERDLQDHTDALLSAVPPIETGLDLNQKTPTEFTSILNVGWVLLLTQLDDFRVRTAGNGDITEKADKLHSLLLKAVELSEASRVWRSAT